MNLRVLQYVCVAAALGVAVPSGSLLARLFAGGACVAAVVSIDLIYRGQVAYWRRRWEQEHKNFQRWIRSDLERRR